MESQNGDQSTTVSFCESNRPLAAFAVRSVGACYGGLMRPLAHSVAPSPEPDCAPAATATHARPWQSEYVSVNYMRERFVQSQAAGAQSGTRESGCKNHAAPGVPSVARLLRAGV